MLCKRILSGVLVAMSVLMATATMAPIVSAEDKPQFRPLLLDHLRLDEVPGFSTPREQMQLSTPRAPMEPRQLSIHRFDTAPTYPSLYYGPRPLYGPSRYEGVDFGASRLGKERAVTEFRYSGISDTSRAASTYRPNAVIGRAIGAGAAGAAAAAAAGIGALFRRKKNENEAQG